MLNARVNIAIMAGQSRKDGEIPRIGHRQSVAPRCRCRYSYPRIDRSVRGNDRCLRWVAVAIRQIQRSIAAAPPPILQATKEMATATAVADASVQSSSVRPIWVLSTAAICSYLWTTWEAVADRRSQIGERRSQAGQLPNPRHASVLITTKNNDRLRLLEAIWPTTFTPCSGFCFSFILLSDKSFQIYWLIKSYGTSA